MLHLQTRYDLSVNEMIHISRTHALVRTPHVGNMVLRDLFAAQCGFPILWVDNTIPKRDANANPHLLIKDGKAAVIANGGQPLDCTLTADADVTVGGFEDQGFICGHPLTDGHLNRLRSIFPNTRITTLSEYYHSNEGRLRQVLEVATDVLPRSWYRVVQDDGTVRTFKSTEDTGVDSWEGIKNHLRLGRGSQGWVVPNVFAILFDAIQRSVETGLPEAWMLSGPDMIRYLPELMPSLQVAYDAVRRKINHHPEMTIHLVPFGCFRFAVRNDRREHLNALMKHLWENPNNRSERAELATGCPDLWTRTERQKYFSQHDMTSPDDLYVPDHFKHLPLGTLQLLYAAIYSDLPREHR